MRDLVRGIGKWVVDDMGTGYDDDESVDTCGHWLLRFSLQS